MASILFLTVHKSASRFLAQSVLPALANDLGFEHLNPEAANLKAGRAHLPINIDHLARRDGVVVGPIRKPREISDPRHFRTWSKLLLLRDPRDVLVSYHYSQARSHSAPPGSDAVAMFEAERLKSIQRTVDEDVLERADMIRDRYENYRARFVDQPTLTLLRYEDMVTDWPSFIYALAVGCEPRPSEAWRTTMMKLQDSFTVERERPEEHKRQVMPGDHRRKLQAETIIRLNQKMGAVLDWLNLDH